MSLIFTSRAVRFFWWIFIPIFAALIFILLVIKVFMTDYYPLKEKPYLTQKSAKEKDNTKEKEISADESLENLVLKACYVEKDNTFIMFEDEKKMHTLSINSSYKGAKLIKVKRNKAIFSKNSKDIILTLGKGVKKSKEEEKIEQIRDAFNELREDVKKKESKYKRQIADLKYELKEREKFYRQKYTKVNAKPKKLKLVDFVECADMKYGTNKVSLTCKEKVDNFLSKYDASYYYEVVPIVSNGGFASLGRLQRLKKNIISDREIRRLTSLANLGLGRYRAEAGGKLVLKKFGDFAKISYGVENIDKGKKRGFIIRVYR